MNVFDLAARLTLDKSAYESGLNDAEKSAGGFGTKIAGGLGMIAKGAVAGIGAATSAAGVLVKQSVGAYGNMEQLVGGVETLFKGSAGVVEEYAKNAYKTAGLSSNEYMETVTSFSASLLQSLGGDTEAAAQKADVAITDMSDNANKMGTSMESIQNAYNGFAKQNYTMLDNLKLGYGGTKEEMQRLLSDAEKLPAAMGRKFDLSNYGDIVDAIHLVQDDMGITGTTSREAATTIEGSVGMMKSSWENLIAGMADKNADFGALIDNFVESVKTVGTNIIPVVEQAISGVGQLVEEMLPVVVDEIPTIINDVLPDLLESGISMVTTIFEGIQQNLPLLIDSAMNIISMIADTIITMLPEIIKMGMEIILQLIIGLAEALPDLIPQIVDTVILIVETLIDNIDLLIDAGIQLLLALTEGIINAIPRLIDKVPEIVQKLVSAFVRNAPKLIGAALKLIQQLALGISENVPKVYQMIPKIVVAIVNGFIDGVSSLKKAGGQLISGLWNGINDKVDWVVGKIKGMGSKILSAVKSVFGIHSPSKEFAKIGTFLAEGLGQGWDDNIDAVQKDIVDSLDMDYAASATLGSVEVGAGGGSYMAQILSMLQQYLPQIDQPMVLDTGVLVGATASKMDIALGQLQISKGRGR